MVDARTTKPFTWSGGDWVSILPQGVFYYSESIREEVFTDDVEFVTYQIDGDTIDIQPHNEEPTEGSYYRVNTDNSRVRTFAKKFLIQSGYELPKESKRFAADVKIGVIQLEVPELASSDSNTVPR